MMINNQDGVWHSQFSPSLQRLNPQNDLKVLTDAISGLIQRRGKLNGCNKSLESRKIGLQNLQLT